MKRIPFERVNSETRASSCLASVAGEVVAVAVAEAKAASAEKMDRVARACKAPAVVSCNADRRVVEARFEVGGGDELGVSVPPF